VLLDVIGEHEGEPPEPGAQGFFTAEGKRHRRISTSIRAGEHFWIFFAGS